MLNRDICCNGRPWEVAFVRISRQGEADSCRLAVRSKTVVVAQNNLSRYCVVEPNIGQRRGGKAKMPTTTGYEWLAKFFNISKLDELVSP